MTPINLKLSPMEARVLAVALRVVAKRPGAARWNASEWRAMLRAVTKLEAAVDQQRRARLAARAAAAFESRELLRG